jgi:hypothetical protein
MDVTAAFEIKYARRRTQGSGVGVNLISKP